MIYLFRRLEMVGYQILSAVLLKKGIVFSIDDAFLNRGANV
jgi:hypothetical protein